MRHFFIHFDRVLRNNKTVLPAFWLLLGAVSLWIDSVTGPLLKFPVLFVLPIFLSAWYNGLLVGIGIGVMILGGEVVLFGFTGEVIEAGASWHYYLVRVGLVVALAFLVDLISRQRRQIQALQELLPVCGYCKKICDAAGCWSDVESYIRDNSGVEVSHSLCPECVKKYCGAFLWRSMMIRKELRENNRHAYDMGIIGNCAALAYIDRRAEVRWMCLPRFESPAVFGSLLDEDQGGRFLVCPAAGPVPGEQHYLQNTNILVTEFTADDGRFRVTDFMPRFQQYDRFYRPLLLVRRIEPIAGTPRVQVSCRPVAGWGETLVKAVPGSNHVRYLGFPVPVRLTTDVPIAHVLDERPFVLSKTRYLAFTWGEPLEAPLTETCEHFLDETLRYWRRWVKSTSLPVFHQAALIRSALALKLHQYEDTGGVIAAGTTSLPEAPGSGRTWDYRYCWLRDAFFTLNAFSSLGHFEETERMFDYLLDLVRTERDELRPMYTVTGERTPVERELSCPGYRNERPVRIGNGATVQAQHDVYGQALACLLPLYIDERLRHSRGAPDADLVRWLLDAIGRVLESPDAGIWEYRGRVQLHSYALLSHWMGCDAAVTIGSVLGDAALHKSALGLRKRASALLESCFDSTAGYYGQAVGTHVPDAAGYLLVTSGYLDHSRSVAMTHVDNLTSLLDAGGGLLYRYRHEDDFGAPETCFLCCSFWHAEALARIGRQDEAADLFSRLLEYGNHLGLFSEDVAPGDGSQWGNFPQTYVHAGMLNAAFRIAARPDWSPWSNMKIRRFGQ